VKFMMKILEPSSASTAPLSAPSEGTAFAFLQKVHSVVSRVKSEVLLFFHSPLFSSSLKFLCRFKNASQNQDSQIREGTNKTKRNLSQKKKR
jgi:hypothetical protein